MLIFKYSIHSKLSISLLEPVAFEFRVIFFLSFCRDTHFSLCGGVTISKKNQHKQSEMQLFLPPSFLLRFKAKCNSSSLPPSCFVFPRATIIASGEIAIARARAFQAAVSVGRIIRNYRFCILLPVHNTSYVSKKS